MLLLIGCPFPLTPLAGEATIARGLGHDSWGLLLPQFAWPFALVFDGICLPGLCWLLFAFLFSDHRVIPPQQKAARWPWLLAIPPATEESSQSQRAALVAVNGSSQSAFVHLELYYRDEKKASFSNPEGRESAWACLFLSD